MLIFPPQKYFAQCHASTLAQLKDGRIFAAWFAGTRESYPDTAIWMATLNPNEKSWCEPVVIAKIDDIAHWNPVLFTFEEKVYLFFKVGALIENWLTYYKVWENEKWSEPKILIQTNDIISKYNRGPVRSKPIVLSNGHWIAPSSAERTIAPSMFGPSNYLAKPDVVWKAFVDISKNEGKNWNKSKLIDFERKKYGLKNGKYGGVIQPTLWESSTGNVHMLLRSTAEYIFRSDSDDYGKTWCQAYPTDLPNNNSGIDVVNMKERLFLIFNPVAGNWAARTPLSLVVSGDNGKSWSKPINIQEGQGSFSYPSIIAMNGGVGVTYTWNRLSIDFVKINFKNKENVV